MTKTYETPVARINLVPKEVYWRDTYGIVLVSETYHDVVGPGVHNRHFPHQVDVWDNSARVNDDGTYRGPDNKSTDRRYTFSLKARSVAIVADSAMADRTPHGVALQIGQTVELAVHEFVIGRFKVAARQLGDPDLVPVKDREEVPA
jgi:hypothetical protein